jgi:CBS domain-containing protein
MISPVVTVDVKKTIHEAARVMGEKRIGSVVVTKDSDPVGIFTERDLLTKAMANSMDLKKLKVEDCMSRPLITVEEETPLKDALILMASRGIMRLPITAKGELVGIVTGSEIFSFLSVFIESLL